MENEDDQVQILARRIMGIENGTLLVYQGKCDRQLI